MVPFAETPLECVDVEASCLNKNCLSLSPAEAKIKSQRRGHGYLDGKICDRTCVSIEFDAFLKPITSLPPGSIRLNVTAKEISYKTSDLQDNLASQLRISEV